MRPLDTSGQPDVSRVRNAAHEFANAFRRWETAMQLQRSNEERAAKQVEDNLIVLVREIRSAMDDKHIKARDVDVALAQGMRHYRPAMDFLAGGYGDHLIPDHTGHKVRS